MIPSSDIQKLIHISDKLVWIQVLKMMILTIKVLLQGVPLREIFHLNRGITICKVHNEKGVWVLIRLLGLVDKVFKTDIPQGNLT